MLLKWFSEVRPVSFRRLTEYVRNAAPGREQTVWKKPGARRRQDFSRKRTEALTGTRDISRMCVVSPEFFPEFRCENTVQS